MAGGDTSQGKHSLKQGYCEGDELESDLDGDFNRVGDVDMSLYEADEHVGYNVLGQKVARSLPRESALNNFLKSTSDEEWRIITDQKNQSTYRLTDRDLEIIRRVREGKLGVAEINEEDFQVEYEFNEGHLPLRHYRAKKGSFVPGGEEKKILKLVKLIKQGLFVPRRTAKSSTAEVSDIWMDNLVSSLDHKGRVMQPSLAPPKRPLPTHRESYNPSPEYLLTDEEKAKWQDTHPDDRLHDFLPKSHQSMRHIEGYVNIYKESFARCLDLYLCPRALRSAFPTDSRELLPQIPNISQFKPFPLRIGMVVKDHGSDVMCLHFDNGTLAAGYRDGSLAIHNIASKPFYIPEFYPRTKSSGIAYSVQTITYHNSLPLLIFSRAQYLFICMIRRPQTSHLELKDLVQRYWANDDPMTSENVSRNLLQYVEAMDAMRTSDSTVLECSIANRPQKVGVWRSFKSQTYFDPEPEPGDLGDDDGSVQTSGEEDETDEDGERRSLGHAALVHKDWLETLKFVDLLRTHNKYVVAGYVVALGVKPAAVSVHSKGAYIATAAPNAPTPSSQCLLHHLKKKKSLAPLRKLSSHGAVESVRFHPAKSNLLIVGFPRTTCIYDLHPSTQVHIATRPDEKTANKASVVQKFKGSDTSTAMEILHDYKNDNTHILRVTTDGRFQWYDCDYGSTPYKTIEISETGSLTSVRCHPYLPLVAAGTSKTHIQLFHAAPDELTEIQIQPLVKLMDKESHITALAWHPQNHWLASGHSNGRIIIWI